jgi:hypothetical protein
MSDKDAARRWAGRLLDACRAAALTLPIAVTVAGCNTPAPPSNPAPVTHLHTDRTYLRDDLGRYVFFHGVNASGTTKLPFEDEGDTFTYIGRPFPLSSARSELSRLRDMGFNSMRLLLTWEAVEPDAPGQYDESYLSYIRQVVQLAGEYGIYVLMDMHQDMFSRHLMVKYNANPDLQYGAPGTIQNSVLSLLPPYTDVVQGDGAPRWVVEACMPEKDLSSPHWGVPRIASGLNNLTALADLDALYSQLTGSTTSGGAIPPWIQYMVNNLPAEFQPNESTDMLPFTNWGITAALSMDVERAYACLFAGDVVFPGLDKDGTDIKDYLQSAYANMWAEVARHVSDLPNVMGYDMINEPEGNFLVLGAEGALLTAQAPNGAQNFLVQLMGTTTGTEVYNTMLALRLLPPDMTPATLKLWGLDKLSATAAIELNVGFDINYLSPFYNRVGQAILAVDPKAVFFLEPSTGISSILGASSSLTTSMWDMSMTSPPDLPQVVFSPHYYADIYPFLGFNQPPRDFTLDQVRYRDYTSDVQSAMFLASHSLGNTPVVFGEFGTYFNFNGIESSIANNYIVSSALLNNYYEAFENLFQSNIVWCESKGNTYANGDGWNHEDFSIMDPSDQPRSDVAWARPSVRALAGKPISTHFYSDLHYFDPDKGTPNPQHEFEVTYASRETDAPTEISVPEVQYPNGFYVWVTDGTCYYDPTRHILYHYPDNDLPGAQYTVKILPPLANNPATGWQYFFDGDQVLTH